MQSSFDMIFDRSDNQTMKWDAERQRAGNPDLLCFGTADMDFQSPYPVRRAVRQTADIGHFGYPLVDNAYYSAIEQWLTRIAGWKIDARKCVSNNVGIYTSIWCLIDALTDPGDEIIIQQPVHFCFEQMIRLNGRAAVVNPLICKNNRYEMDFEQLESCFTNKTKVFWLCNPHNPVGRAWTAAELEKLVDICERKHVIVVSDEIHADLMMDGHEHHALCAVSEKARKFVITQYAPSKTFNLAGLQTSYAVIPDAQLREAFLRQQTANRLGAMNWFGAAALVTAYTKCDDYVTALCDYVSANMDYMVHFLKERLPELKMTKPEATYMVWVDFRGTGMSTEEIEKFILEKAHIATDMGSWFRDGGEGYLRFNLACPRSILEKALLQLEKALHA